jgi:hypothetical protein
MKNVVEMAFEMVYLFIQEFIPKQKLKQPKSLNGNQQQQLLQQQMPV